MPAQAAPTASTGRASLAASARPVRPARPAAPALGTGCTQSGSTVTCKYTSAGEHQFTVPSGISTVTATVVGGQGGGDFGLGEPGGLGAIGTGTISSLTPGQVLFAEVGILGGAAGQLLPGFADSGAGGGESDVRTCPSTGNQPCAAGSTLASRLLVAGGGGGRGDFGGSGGNAGTPAPGGNGSTGSGKNPGGVGTGGTATAPGSGGSGCDGGGNGAPGAAAGGAGGNAGASNSQDGVSGGGGGGGWFGGGAGGGCGNANDDGGSGGGGSSHAASSLTGVSFSQAAGGQAPSVTITYTALAVTTSFLPDGEVGQAYSTTLAAGGGTTPFTWSLGSGSLPDGLKLSSAGTISGTPQAGGTFDFSVQVTDSGSPQQTATQSFSIFIAKASTLTELAIDPSQAAVGDTISLTAEILQIPGSNGPAPGGTMTFTANGTTVCDSVAITAGTARCSISLNTPGTYSIAANYSGDSNYTGSADTNSTYQVRKAGARPGLTIAPSSGATVDTSLAFTVTLNTNGSADPPTGTVSFDIGGNTVSGCGSVPVANLTAVCSVPSPLPAGTYTIDATYNGDSEYVATETQVTGYKVGQATPTVTLAAAPASGATSASSISLSANVSGANGAPAATGTVQFLVNGSTVSGCASATVTSGTATCSVGGLNPGTYTLEAIYSGDTNFLTSSDTISNYQVQQVTATVSMSASPDFDATTATPVTMTTNVTGPNGATAPTGTVKFEVDGSVVPGCSAVKLSSGSASCDAGDLSPGFHNLQSFYSGDSLYQGDSAGIFLYPVGQATPTVALSASPSSGATVADSVSATAKVTVPAGAPDPTGTVDFTVDGTTVPGCGSVTVTSGSAACPVGNLPAGSHDLKADYSGDTNYLPADDSIASYSVAQVTPTVELTASPPAGATVADPVSATATVFVPPNAPNPTGTVDFTVDGTTVPGCGSVTVTSGSATCSVGTLPAGTHKLEADYSGDSNYNAASGAISNYQIPQASPGVSLSATPAAGALVTDSVGLSATVVPVAGGPDPTGTVTFLVNGKAPAGCTNVSLAGGTATCAVGKLAAGTYAFESDYSGDTNYVAASDTVTNYVVSKLASTVAVKPSMTAPVWGQPVSFTATVTVAGAPATSGTVQWVVDAIPVGSPVPVGADGTASLGPLTDLSVGSDDIVAEYSGTDQNAGNNGDVLVVVGKAATSSTIAVTSKRLTATVKPVAPGAGQPTGVVTFTISGKSVGTANLSAKGVASLAFKSSGAEVAAVSYAGDDHFTGSTASTSTTNPVITAKVTSAHPKTSFGWYRSAVTITFTCKAGSAPLKTPCPHPVTLGNSAAAQSVSRTISDTDGGLAMITVSPVNIDQKAPVVKVDGIKNGGNYNAPGPAKITCHASDALSGLASPCALKVVRGPLHITWTAKATDKAGNAKTITGTANLTDFYVDGVPKVSGAYQVKIGSAYMVKAFVVTTKAPRYVFAAPQGVTPHPVGPKMRKIGQDLWAIEINITKKMNKHKFWTLGVQVGTTLHKITIQLHS